MNFGFVFTPIPKVNLKDDGVGRVAVVWLLTVAVPMLIELIWDLAR